MDDKGLTRRRRLRTEGQIRGNPGDRRAVLQKVHAQQTVGRAAGRFRLADELPVAKDPRGRSGRCGARCAIWRRR